MRCSRAVGTLSALRVERLCSWPLCPPYASHPRHPPYVLRIASATPLNDASHDSAATEAVTDATRAHRQRGARTTARGKPHGTWIFLDAFASAGVRLEGRS